MFSGNLTKDKDDEVQKLYEAIRSDSDQNEEKVAKFMETLPIQYCLQRTLLNYSDFCFVFKDEKYISKKDKKNFFILYTDLSKIDISEILGSIQNLIRKRKDKEIRKKLFYWMIMCCLNRLLLINYKFSAGASSENEYKNLLENLETNFNKLLKDNKKEIVYFVEKIILGKFDGNKQQHARAPLLEDYFHTLYSILLQPGYTDILFVALLKKYCDNQNKKININDANFFNTQGETILNFVAEMGRTEYIELLDEKYNTSPKDFMLSFNSSISEPCSKAKEGIGRGETYFEQLCSTDRAHRLMFDTRVCLTPLNQAIASFLAKKKKNNIEILKFFMDKFNQYITDKEDIKYKNINYFINSPIAYSIDNTRKITSLKDFLTDNDIEKDIGDPELKKVMSEIKKNLEKLQKENKIYFYSLEEMIKSVAFTKKKGYSIDSMSLDDKINLIFQPILDKISSKTGETEQFNEAQRILKNIIVSNESNSSNSSIIIPDLLDYTRDYYKKPAITSIITKVIKSIIGLAEDKDLNEFVKEQREELEKLKPNEHISETQKKEEYGEIDKPIITLTILESPPEKETKKQTKKSNILHRIIDYIWYLLKELKEFLFVSENKSEKLNEKNSVSEQPNGSQKKFQKRITIKRQSQELYHNNYEI
jgi:hypothetical protein